MAGEPTDKFDLMPASIFIYVEDCDATYEQAMNYGCESIMPVETMHEAHERYGGVQDKNGNIWWISTHQPLPQSIDFLFLKKNHQSL